MLLEDGTEKAWGETVFIPYYNEDLTSFKELLSKIDLPDNLESLEDIHSFITRIKGQYPENTFSIAGIGTLLHNLIANKQKKSIRELYNITGTPPTSSFTLGISDKTTMQQKINENPEVAYFKLKVSENTINQIFNDYKELSDKPFVVDANQGFTNKELALNWAIELHKAGVAYLEQPFAKDDLDSHQWLKEKSPIPIIADESFQTTSDIYKLKHAFDGINVKLMKSGGIGSAVESLKAAKGAGLKTILGCMSESSVGINAAMEIAPLADWIDLDGHLLIDNDLFSDDADLSDFERIEILKRSDD